MAHLDFERVDVFAVRDFARREGVSMVVEMKCRVRSRDRLGASPALRPRRLAMGNAGSMIPALASRGSQTSRRKFDSRIGLPFASQNTYGDAALSDVQKNITHWKQAKRAPAIVLQKITTFDESIEAAKIVSRAIEDGVIDDAGEIAEITPEDLMIDTKTGAITGVVVTIRSTGKMVEGVCKTGRFVREVSSGNVHALSPVKGRRRQESEIIETRMAIPVKPAA